MADIQSIVMVRLSALGDVLMSVPLVRSMQATYPKAKITWIISRPAYDLVEGLDGVEFIVMDKPRSLRDYWAFYQKMRGRRFDVLLAMQANYRVNFLYPWIRAQRKISYDLRRGKDCQFLLAYEKIQFARQHTLEGFLQFGAAIGVKQAMIRWDVTITESTRAWAKQKLPAGQRYLLINAAASQAERSWLVERYAAVSNLAPRRWGVQVILIGGPLAYDRQLADAIIERAPQCWDWVGTTQPKQLLALIERAHMVLCPDTGPSHMAASVNTPVVAMHAVTSSLVSGPYGFQDLVVDAYPEILMERHGLTTDQHAWTMQLHGDDVMARVSLDAVIQKLDLANQRKPLAAD